MTARTLGTNAATSLTGLLYGPAYTTADAAADWATVMAAILDDGAMPAGGTRTNPLPVQDHQAANTRGPMPGALSPNGLLVIPNRGVLRLLPGDFVGVDNVGWPILVSANSIANGAWTHT